MAPARVWLIDHYSWKPPDEYKISMDDVYGSAMTQSLKDSPFNKGSTDAEREACEEEAQDIIQFMHRVWEKSGLSIDQTHLPPSIHPRYCGANPQTDLNAAYKECHEAMCGAVQGLLHKTGLNPKDIDILITTCSIYCPTPSMASMIVNHFKMRPDIQSYHLAGMGCSNGVTAINLVRDLLIARPNSNVVFVCNETTTRGFYAGRDKSKLVPNMLFRLGACAQLLSNKASWQGRAKYQLLHSYRVNTAARDDAYRCIWYGPDEDGNLGVSLGKDVVVEASRALTKAMTAVAPHVMTWTQIRDFIAVLLRRKWAKATGGTVPPSYTPAFNEGVQHFLLHAGGAKVLDGLGQALKLSEHALGPSRAVLFDYGNVSSSTTWYALGYIETMRGVKAGDKVMQVGVGSGIKCGVNVWQALRPLDDCHAAWERRVTTERRAVIAAAPQPEGPGSHTWLPLLLRCVVLLVLLAAAAVLLVVSGLAGRSASYVGAVVKEVVEGQWWSSMWGGAARHAALLVGHTAKEL